MNTQDQRRQLGAAGENAVVEYLHNHGFLVTGRNIAWRGGEIDIIARKQDIVVFVEVKTRTHTHFALSAVVTPSKQRKIAQTAQHYCAKHNFRHHYIIRFDIALVERVSTDWQITYIPNAFQAPEELL